uniref:Uncharacterized protein n=1 Tax=Micrurus spixii TaxID=129469 RepID=A0A2D4MQG7_9SAUR
MLSDLCASLKLQGLVLAHHRLLAPWLALLLSLEMGRGGAELGPKGPLQLEGPLFKFICSSVREENKQWPQNSSTSFGIIQFNTLLHLYTVCGTAYRSFPQAWDFPRFESVT